MPDRQKASDFEPPLSLVVVPHHHGGAGDSRRVKSVHGSSPGRSSGFSEGSDDHHYRRRLTSEDLPLALVVREIGESEYSDSGQEEDPRCPPEEPDVTIAKVSDAGEKSGIKIKDFAKLLVEKESSDAASEASWRGPEHVSYPCEFCEKIFINKYHLQSHLVTHTGERSFECRKCHKSFGRKSTLRAHMTTHTKVSNFMCPICDKACNDNNSLEEHIRMHTGEKPFVCSICSKSYARKSHLNVHYRVHTGERPFVCLNCRKDFTEKRFLNDHIQTAHSGQDGPLKCPNCFREFAYKTSLKQHLKKQMCVKNLNRSGHLISNGGSNANAGGASGGQTSSSSPSFSAGGHQAHPPSQQQSHSKQFSCPFCEKSYSWKQTLKQHVSMYHRNKVHTDEFWKYELTKHRRAVVDSKTNEDMWKKQLGKHGSEQPKSGEGANELWLEQIQGGSSSGGSKSSQMSAEMKLLALQSLQSSLKLMKMQEGPAPAATPPQDTGYLSLLAHISSAQQRVAEKEDRSESPALPEEPAAKRTQMWLAQLGRYRQKSVQYEIEKNHEELWEEQIAKIKQNPVKSPLEPLEITIDDDEEGPPLIKEEEEGASEAAEEECPPPPPGFKMVPLMSALEVHREDAEQISTDGGSVLKSLLLDRFGRKRPSLDPSPVPPKATAPTEDSTDILRRRLLGLKEEELPSEDPPQPLVLLDIDAENNNTHHSSGEDANNNSLSEAPKKEEQPKPAKDYARTSVLKHLLHRYTESHNME